MLSKTKICFILVVFVLFLAGPSLLVVPADAAPEDKATETKAVEPSAINAETIDSIRKDRDNLAVQAQRLLEEKKVLMELKNEHTRISNERDEIRKEADALKMQVKALNGEIEQEKKKTAKVKREISRISALYNQLLRKKEELEKEVAKIRLESGIDEMATRIAALETENANLKTEKETVSGEVSNLTSKIEDERAVYTDHLNKQKGETEKKINQYENRLAELQEKYSVESTERKALGQQLAHLPNKFSAMARENDRLARVASDRHYNLGVFYAKSAEYRLAMAEFQEALKIKPDHAYALYNMGNLYATHIVDRAASIKYFKEYLKAAPDAKDKDMVLKYILTWQTMSAGEAK